MDDRGGRRGSREEGGRRKKEERGKGSEEVGRAHSGNEAFLRECRHIIPPSDWPLKSSAWGIVQQTGVVHVCLNVQVQV